MPSFHFTGSTMISEKIQLKASLAEGPTERRQERVEQWSCPLVATDDLLSESMPPGQCRWGRHRTAGTH